MGQMSQEFFSGRSYLCANPETITDALALAAPIDQREADGAILTVKELRQLIATISAKPYGTVFVLAIDNADQMSPILQTTLLKTIEEPPPSAIIVLRAENEERLLSTVRSRVQRIASERRSRREEGGFSPDTLQNQDRSVCVAQLTQLQGDLLRRQPISPELLELIHQTVRRLQSNCNQKLTIDRFLLRYRRYSGIE